jgi:uncharacterized protein YjbI with pentapeptide repeats
MLVLLLFAFSLHAADVDCENPASRDLNTWKGCRSLKYLAMGKIDLTGSIADEIGCYRCGFSEVKFRGGPYALRLRESRVSRAHCEEANMNAVKFMGLKAPGFDSRDCNFEGADFTTAVLKEARFVRGNFRGAIFAGADLSGAEFIDTDLRGADFSQALMVRARFQGVKYDDTTKIPEGFHWPR